MVKRILSLGCTIMLTFSLSLTSFANSDSSVTLGFPFFSYLNLYQGNTALYSGSSGSRPISGTEVGVSGDTSSSSYIVDLVLGSSYSFSESATYSLSGDSTPKSSMSISYQVPVVVKLDEYDGNSYSGSYVGSSSGSGQTYTFGNGHVTYRKISETTSVTVPTYSTTVDGTFRESVSIRNNVISGGDYAISGFFVYPEGTLSDLSDLFIGTAKSFVYKNSEETPILVDISDLYLNLNSNSGQVVEFLCVVNVPMSVNGATRFRLVFDTVSNVDAPLNRFGVSTGGFEYTDSVSGFAGLTSSLGNWFSGIKSQLGSISALLRSRDRDMNQAASQANSQAVSEAASTISEIHDFEQSLNSNITSGVQNIDFTVPSGTGFIAALGAISLIFTGIFNGLGVYQYIITIPLILGLVLLLVGRGQSALGRHLSAEARASRRGDS